MDYSGKVFFAVGTGRCGTKFLSQVIAKENDISAHHEKHPLPDTFQRFCKWYQLPIDNRGFLHNKELSIVDDLRENHISFESSAYLSLSIKELYGYFKGKFILMVRNPKNVVESYYRKGWYNDEIQISNSEKIPSFQQSLHFHHFLGRTIPVGSDFDRWKNLTRIGKLGWYWNKLNKSVIHQFNQIEPSSFRIIKLEDFDYLAYRSLLEDFFQTEPTLSEHDFNLIARQKPNSSQKSYSYDMWNVSEIEEFRAEVKEMSAYFDYK